MKLTLSGTCRSDFRLFVRSNIPVRTVHSLLTGSHAKPAQTSTVPRWVMTEFQPSGPFATLEPSTAVGPTADIHRCAGGWSGRRGYGYRAILARREQCCIRVLD